MDAFTITMMYRMSLVLVGGWIVFMGYRLFTTGMFESASDLKLAWGENYLVLKQAAPGTIFALFGAAILAFSIFKGVFYEQTESSGSVSQPMDFSNIFGSTHQDEMLALIETLIDGGDLDSDQKTKLLEWVNTKKTTIRAFKEPPSDENTS